LTLRADGTFAQVSKAPQELIVINPPRAVSGKWREQWGSLRLEADQPGAGGLYNWELRTAANKTELRLTAAGYTQVYYKTETTSANPTPTAVPADKIEALVNTAAANLNAFWRAAFQTKGVSYIPPRIVRSAKADEYAYYDPQANSIIYSYDFFNTETQRHGDFVVATTLAHEWGHLAQVQLNDCVTATIEMELQADCLAGAFAKEESAAGRFAQGDLDAAMLTLLQVSDLPEMRHRGRGMEGVRVGEHGSPLQRNTAFKRGLAFGVGGCSCEVMKKLGDEPF
jgi:predicted metalloprotease